MAKFSIMDYSFRSYEKLKGREGYGFSCYLCYKGEKIAVVEDFGDGGGCNTTSFTGDKAKICADLSDIVKTALSKGYNPDSLSDLVSNEYGASQGIVWLLQDLMMFVKGVEKPKKACLKTGYPFYGIAMLGSSYINDTGGYSSLIVSTPLPYADSSKSLDTFIKEVKKYMAKESLAFQGMAFLQGDYDWNLTKDEFFDLFDANGLD